MTEIPRVNFLDPRVVKVIVDGSISPSDQRVVYILFFLESIVYC